MINYNTGIKASPPISGAMQEAGIQGLRQQAISGYPGPAADVYQAASQRRALDMERYAVSVNNQHMANAQQEQQAAALQGLQGLSQQQQNAYNLGNQQAGMRLDYAGNLLGGLNGLLSGLFNY